MKKLITLFLLLLAVQLIQAQDTIDYGDTNYFLGEIESPNMRLEAIGIGMHESAAQKGFLGCEYAPSAPTLIYGIALTMRDADIDFLKEAMLIAKEGSGANVIYTRVDSVAWRKRSPDKYMDYYLSDCVGGDTTRSHNFTPMYEFYFETPYLMVDTFYVGATTTTSNVSMYISTPHPCQGVTHHWLHCWELQNQGLYYSISLYGKGGAYPILIPPTYDSVSCPLVSNFTLAGQQMDMAWFTWDTVGEQTEFQVSVTSPGADPDSGRLMRPYQSPHYISGLESDTNYAVYIRARCHHACPVHDTTLWGPWSDPVIVSTVGIAQVSSTHPALTLVPNPAHDRVMVSWGQPYPSATLTVTDAHGRESLRQDASNMDCFQLSIHDFQLSAGIHLVNLATPAGTLVRKLVIE